MIELRHCNGCDYKKPLADFRNNNGKFLATCRPCTVYQKDYYQRNRDKIIGQSSNRYASANGRATFLFNSAKRSASKRNIEFTLSLERIQLGLMIGCCERTGIAFDFTPSKKTWRNPFAPSLDRIDSFKGYSDCNIQLVVTLYNYGKGQHTDDEFIEFCHMVALRNPRQHD